MHFADNIIFAQMNAKEGAENFVETAIAAMAKQFTQLGKGVMPGKKAARLTAVKILAPSLQIKHTEHF